MTISAGSLRLHQAAQRWGWLLLLALAPFFLFMSAANSPILLVVPVLLAALWLGRPPATAPRTPLDWTLLLLAAMLLVSLWATFSIAFSLPKIAGLVFGLGLFYAAVSAGRAAPGAWAAVAAVSLALGAGVAGLGLLGTRWSSKIPILNAIATRLPVSLISLPGAENGLQPNEVAGVLLWVAPVAIALALALWFQFEALVQAHGGPASTAMVVATTLVALSTSGVLVLTQSRSALFGLVLALISMLALAVWSRPPAQSPPVQAWPHRLLASVLFLVVAILLVGAGLRFRQPILVYAQQVLNSPGPSAQVSNEVRSLDDRIEIWSLAVTNIKDFPYTGLGLNTFRERLLTVFPNNDLGHAHNTWLQVALDLGLPGLVAYMGVWITTIVMLVQVLHRTGSTPFLRALAIGILGAFAGSFGFGFTDTVALGARPGLLWWLLLALAVLVWMQSQPDGVYSEGQSVSQIDSTVEKAQAVGT